jgi:signal transduction histidine kinase
VPDLEARRFRRNLTAVLTLVGLLTAGSVFLFGHLLFKTLSKDVVDEALLYSRQDAQRIARGLAERAAGDVYTLKVQQKDLDVFVGSALSERQVLSEVRVYDSKNQLVYAYTGLLSRPERAGLRPEGQQTLSTNPLEPSSRASETTAQIADPYGIEVPIGDFGTLKVGVSQRELQARVEVLRGKLYKRIFAAALVSFLGILAASWAVMLLVRRTRKVEAARIEAERRAELGEVATGLAHEIRNPLNAMSLNLELLEEQLEKGTLGLSAAELAAATRVETGRLARLLSDFLSYARPSPLVTVPADLNEPAAEAVSFLQPEARTRRTVLVFQPREGGAPAHLDAARVKQVVLNLVGNALDAVEAEGATAREVDVAIEDGGPVWLLTVSDHGPGLDGKKATDIFRVFVSTKPAGTGMGLPIAERIVKAHGGELTLSSARGEPTRAVASFPKLGSTG